MHNVRGHPWSHIPLHSELLAILDVLPLDKLSFPGMVMALSRLRASLDMPGFPAWQKTQADV